VIADRRNPDNERLRLLIAEIHAECKRLAVDNHERIERERRRITWLLTFVLLILFAVGASTFYLRGADQSRANEAKTLALRIQESRVESVLNQCHEDNQRHNNTINRLDAQLRELERLHPANAARYRQSRAFTVTLIEALAPKRDCAKRARQLAGVPIP
jgi:uncharacterized protein YpuA (DUF1002 family)